MRKERKEFFKGAINGVEFEDKSTYLAMEYFLENVEEKFGEVFNVKFIEDTRDFIWNLYQSEGDLQWGEIESELYFAVQSADSFEDMHIDILGKQWIELNEKLANGDYTLRKGEIE